ncbi:TonB-dependent receptor plug domain protein [Bordetella pertussis H918]|nr:TonB-dependent receptor plug domain protein [Bordetella pertussis H918]
MATGTTAGTKTDTPLIEIPQSISVVTAAQIREQNPQTLGDAVRYTPGIVVQEGFNRTDDPFIIRGFDVRTNPGVMFRDGLKIPLPHYSAMSEPYALERIEVVKGPASVLYGQASPGGIVNVVSKRPTDSPLRELQLSGGSHSNRQLAGDFGGRIDDEGRLTYRLTGLARNADTMIDHVPDDRYYLAPALTWRISPDTSLTLLASYMKNKTINNAGYPLEGTVKYNPLGFNVDLQTMDWGTAVQRPHPASPLHRRAGLEQVGPGGRQRGVPVCAPLQRHLAIQAEPGLRPVAQPRQPRLLVDLGARKRLLHGRARRLPPRR